MGTFVVSLDMELMWGVIDVFDLTEYGNNVAGVKDVIPRLLDIADDYGVHLTFGVVGMCYANSYDDLKEYIPHKKPSYKNPAYSPYVSYINEKVKDKPDNKIYHFAPDLIEMIKRHHLHEIGSHTFCHYYCLADGQNCDEFKADLMSAKEIAKTQNINPQSIIFPRNQCNEEYLKICKDLGFTSYRGNEDNWLHQYVPDEKKLLLAVQRGLRLVDTFFNISGHQTYKLIHSSEELPLNIPASRFLRPYSKTLSFLNKFQLRRIINSMTYAAKHDEFYHLWWHPHNFGINVEENFRMLNKIFAHYKDLKDKYGFTSKTFSEIVTDYGK